MLVRPHNRGIDGMFLVGRRPKTRQGFEGRVPHSELAPTREAHVHRIPIAISFGHVAPRGAGAQNPKNAVDGAPFVFDLRTAFATVGQQWIENAPLGVRQIAATQCCLPQKSSLESKLDSSVKNRQHGLVSFPNDVGAGLVPALLRAPTRGAPTKSGFRKLQRSPRSPPMPQARRAATPPQAPSPDSGCR